MIDYQFSPSGQLVETFRAETGATVQFVRRRHCETDTALIERALAQSGRIA